MSLFGKRFLVMLFKFCGNICGWKSVWKYMLWCLNNNFRCLNTITKWGLCLLAPNQSWLYSIHQNTAPTGRPVLLNPTGFFWAFKWLELGFVFFLQNTAPTLSPVRFNNYDFLACKQPIHQITVTMPVEPKACKQPE